MAYMGVVNDANAEARRKFRFYSRRVLMYPSEAINHEQRINSALQLSEHEPLEGALADFFYGCWYDMPFVGHRIIDGVQDKLRPHVRDDFNLYINKQHYVSNVSPLANRWSVLVAPSMAVAQHRLRTSSDDSRSFAVRMIEDMLDARYDGADDEVAELESEFLDYCIACHDVLAFSLAWFRLGKEDWQFDERWQQCRDQLTLPTSTDNIENGHTDTGALDAVKASEQTASE